MFGLTSKQHNKPFLRSFQTMMKVRLFSGSFLVLVGLVNLLSIIVSLQ